MNSKTKRFKNKVAEFLPDYIVNCGESVQFISLVTETEVKARKTGNPFVGATKIVKRNGLINVDHEARVNRRMVEAGEKPTHVAGSTWYRHVMSENGKPLALCVHAKDPSKKYLQFFPHRNIGKTVYQHNGKKLTEAEVAILKTFMQGESWGDFKEPVITLAMSSILQISARKVKMTTGIPSVKV